MILLHRRVHRTQFGARLVESGPGSEPREQFRHAMRTLRYHCRPEMMRTARDIRDDLGLLRVRDTGLEHADDRTGAITFNPAKLNGFANNRRISPERVRPETIGENDNGSGFRTAILRPNQSAEHRTQSHHVEIGPVDYAAIDLARLA